MVGSDGVGAELPGGVPQEQIWRSCGNVNWLPGPEWVHRRG